MAILNFPDNPQVDDTYVENNVTYTWDGVKWRSFVNEVGVVLTPPAIDDVTLTDTATGTGRFTSNSFDVAVTMQQDGRPASTKSAKVLLTDPPQQLRALTRPKSTEIVDVQTVAFADGFDQNALNDNSWRDVYWCGAPYNCYIAQGNGTSADNFATSTDGQNWTRVRATLNGVDWSPPGNFAYCPLDGTLRVLSYDSSGSPYRKVAWTTDGTASFDFTALPDPVMPSTSADSRFGDLYWCNVTNRWWAVRTYATWDSVSGLLRGPTTADFTNGWTDVGGPKGEHKGRVMIHQDSSATCTWDGRWTEGTNTVDKTYYWADPVNSTTRYSIAKTGWTTFGRWAKVGTIGWVTGGAQSGNGTEGDTIFVHLGNTPPNQQATGIAMTAINPDLTALDIRDSLWIEDLGIAVMCGKASTATRDYEGCIITTTDCANFTFLWTNAPGDTEQYRWSRMFWNTDRQELVLVADQGTNPGSRAGYSQTVGEFLNLPQLTFISAAGLTAFSVGDAVDQSDSNATGMVAAIDSANAQMIVKGTVGTWGPANTGLTVLGPTSSYSPAYARIDADGNVDQIQQFDPGFQQLNGTSPFSINFPATLLGGAAPDAELPAGTRIQVEVKAESSTNGFTSTTDRWSNTVTPT